MRSVRWYRICLYLFVLILIYRIPLASVEGSRLCLWYHLFHIDCFGCGFTRSFFCFMHGEFTKAIAYNKMVFLVPVVWALVVQDSWMILRNSNQLSLLEKLFIHGARWLYPNVNAFKKA